MVLIKKGNYTLEKFDGYEDGTFWYDIYLHNTCLHSVSSHNDWKPEDINNDEFLKSDLYKTFLKFADNTSEPEKSKNSSYKKVSLFGDDYDDDDWSGWSYSGYYYGSGKSYKPTYKTSKEEAIEKYCKSNTLCLHKSDPTTTMLKQIYDGKGWDVINDAYEMSSDTIAELIDRHERIVMLGHGSPGGLIGFITSEHAKHLEPKKLFALWCNADSYCNTYLPNKKGFFACGNMPSDDGEASWQGFTVTHKWMDDNITYWCKLCGDVVEQCLEGNADAGCKYIRDKYWERYHKGDADQVGITIYNYRRTKVAGQDLIPEPEGAEIIGPKETKKELQKSQAPSWKGSFTGFNYPSWSKKSQDSASTPSTINSLSVISKKEYVTTKGYEIEEVEKLNYFLYRVFDSYGTYIMGETILKTQKPSIEKAMELLKTHHKDVDIGEIIKDKKESLKAKYRQKAINEGFIKENEEWPEDLAPELFGVFEFLDDDELHARMHESLKESVAPSEDIIIDRIDDDLNFPRDYCSVTFNISRKDNAENGCLLVLSIENFDLVANTDVDISYEKETYDSPSITEINIPNPAQFDDVFEDWDAEYTNDAGEIYNREAVIELLGVTADELDAIENNCIEIAKEKVSEEAQEYACEHYEEWQEDDYDPRDEYDPDEYDSYQEPDYEIPEPDDGAGYDEE